MDRLLYAAGIIVAVGAAVEVLRRAVGWMIRTVRKLARLADDLLGEPPGPGLPEGRPGLMVRVAGIEKELHPNGGSSMRDAVNRVEQRLEDHIRTHGGTP